MKIFLLLTTSILISTISHAKHSKNSTCYKLQRSAMRACEDLSVSCEHLGVCLHKRNSCPTDIKNKAGCESFTNCLKNTAKISKTAPNGLRKTYFNSPCKYDWSPYGNCRIKTAKAEFMIYPTCPGRKSKIKGKSYSDLQFDCSGQKNLMNYLEKNCKNRKLLYEKKCSNIQGYEKGSIKIKKCE